MVTAPTTNGRTDKSSKKQSKIIVLALPPTTLKKFLPKVESPPAASSPTPIIEEVPEVKAVAPTEMNSEANSTPAPPTQEASTPLNGVKKTGPSSTSGVKRSTPMPDGMLKPRGKPGPKKKPRLEDGTIDHSAKPVATGTANHKLGPKANTGFINANLRALDRSGTPCRKWEKKGFTLKSFTGHAWELPSWKGSQNSLFADKTSDSSNKDISMSSDQKPSESDTAAGSNTGDQRDKMDISIPPASSPPPIQPNHETVPVQA